MTNPIFHRTFTFTHTHFKRLRRNWFVWEYTDKDLREKSVEELTALLDEQQLNQFRLRMAKATGQLGKSHEVALTRKTIARIKTLLTEKQGNGQ